MTTANSRVANTFKISDLKIFLVNLVFLALISCDSFLEVGVPNSKVTAAQVFANDESATSAVIGIYLDLYAANSFAAGGTNGLVSLAGLSSDELTSNLGQDVLSLEFQENEISPRNGYVLAVWTSLYKAIVGSNSVLERLALASSVSKKTKDQLRGEVLFVRAYCNFYLVNLFGEVPLVTSSDYRVNATLSKSSIDQIYDQVKKDLSESESLLSESYIGNGRTRPNRFCVNALQARVYLFTGDWPRAEDKSTKVISASSFYSLPELTSVFLASSPEAIWQLKPADGATATGEGITFGSNLALRYNVLTKYLVNDFEPGDERFAEWVLEIGSGNDKRYLPFKYRKQNLESPTTEYSMVFRLAEQFLVRAEARARQSKLGASISDLNMVRSRAKVPLLQLGDPELSQSDILNLIMDERRVEFMCEWGHRWLDLKRMGVAGSILGPIKNGWTESDVLYPIPESELQKNPSLSPQNSGY